MDISTASVNAMEASCILRDMSDGVITLDKQGKATNINSAACKILGLEKTEIDSQGLIPLVLREKANDDFVQSMLDALYSGVQSEQIVDYHCEGNVRKLHVHSTFLNEEGYEKKMILVLNDVTEAEKNNRYRKDVVIMLTALLGIISLYLLLYAFLDMLSPAWLTSSRLSYLLMLMSFGGIVVILKSTSFRITFFNKEKVGKEMLWALLIVGLETVALILVKLVLMRFTTFFKPETPFICFTYNPPPQEIIYLLSVLVQELMARSFVQDCLTYIMGEKLAGVANLTAALLFGALHIQYGFVFMVGAVLLLGLIGMFYHRTHNLIATTLVHFVTAEMAKALGFLL